MKKESLPFLLFLILALITYSPSIGAGFVYDFLGWQRVYNEGSFADILHCFGYNGNHQLLHFFFYSIYALFHIQGLPWFLIFCTLHAFNAWLLFTWLRQLAGRWQIRMSLTVIYLVSILYLLHPYCVEPVVWKVCLHYLLSFSAVMGLMILAPKFVSGRGRSFGIGCLVIYAASLFLLEISYITPLVLSGFLLVDYFASKNEASLGRRGLMLAGSVWGILMLGLLLNRITLGSWVGHYGAEAHLHFDLLGMMSTEMKYFLKHLVNARFFSYTQKGLLFDTILSSTEVIFACLTLLMSLTILYVIKIRSLSGTWHLVCFGVVGSMLYVAPVSNLFFYHLHIGMNDRFSYIPIAFLWAGLAAIAGRLPKGVSVTLLTLIILMQLYFQQKTIHYWNLSTKVIQGLKASYQWHDYSPVFVLNSPDNYHGIVMASIYGEPSGIDEIIDHQTPKSHPGEMYDIFQFNMATPGDGVIVEQTGPLQLKVTFNQWGNWWHRNGIGASSYENDYYTADMQGHHYILTFKKFPEQSAIIYQDGDIWKEFKMEVE